MVNTRAMSGTTKKTDTKIAVNDKQKASTTARNKAKSRTTKKVANEIAVNDKQKASTTARNKAKSRTTKKVANKGGTTLTRWSVMDDAYCFFMKDSKAKYYEKHAKYYETHQRGPLIPEKLRKAIMLEWRDMSDTDKAPFVERAEELRAQGRTYLD